jgi:hypothetical protein
MPTTNPKISAYVPQDLYDHFINFKEQRGLSSASQAAIVILTEFFGCGTPSRLPSDSPGVPLEEFQALVQRVDHLSELVKSLTVPTTQQDEIESPVKQLPLLTQDSDLVADLEQGIPLSSSLSSPNDKLGTLSQGLSARGLAERMNRDHSTILRRSKSPNFSAWSKDLDPENISWIYDEKTKKFFPFSEPR